MNTPIDRFDGSYRWLSNFWISPITYNGTQYDSVEHAYQAMKCANPLEAFIVGNAATPALAKKFAKTVNTKDNWHDIKFGIMLELVRIKFQTHEYLKELLLATDYVELIEGNTWGDIYWGVCNGIGENNLGKILMQVRTEIQDKILHFV